MSIPKTFLDTKKKSVLPFGFVPQKPLMQVQVPEARRKPAVLDAIVPCHWCVFWPSRWDIERIVSWKNVVYRLFRSEEEE
jgi:hypothetical protein